MELHLPPKPTPTVLPGECRFAAAGLAHGHIYGMVNGLLDAGAELVGVWDEDLKKVSADVYKRQPCGRARRMLNSWKSRSESLSKQWRIPACCRKRWLP